MRPIDQTTIKRIGKIPGVLADLGFSKLRDHQATPIQRSIQEQDQFVVLPTGGGKSLVYIVPTLCCEFHTLIFSPLVALIKDQLESLLKKGCRAAAISTLYEDGENARALRDWSMGELDFLLVAPERLENEAFLRAMRTQAPDCVVVDEIHVASEHAFNFRPSYRKIAPFICELNPKVFLGLTATMPENVEGDLRLIFNAQDTIKTVSYYSRTNLKMESRPWRSDYDLLAELNKTEGSTIVYFSTVNHLEDAYRSIGKQIKGNACIFHGRLSKGIKDTNQNMFMDGSVKVVFATNSFGMGVDKENIRSVIYADIPGSIEELSQGFGRGGRDGKDCKCIFFWNEATLDTQKFFIEIGFPSRVNVSAFYNAVKSRLNSDGLCDLRLGDLCYVANINPMYSQAVSAILMGEGVLERVKLEKPLRVKPVKEAKTGATQKTMRSLVDLGVRNESDGFYEIDKDFLADQLGVNVGTLSRNLKNLEKQQCILLEDPGNTASLKPVKELHAVDFKKLDQRRADAFTRLKQVAEFYRLDDSGKHPYLTEYFKNDGK